MSHRSSDLPPDRLHRPSDHVDGDDSSIDGDDVASPRLGVRGWLRWGWRQLTSMRTALVLLLLLAIAAVPGSIFPQRGADPNGVVQYRTDHSDIFSVLDTLQLFDVYSSVWFSAIYLLLFISLIGCVIPRLRHHFVALRARPPRTPARLERLDVVRSARIHLPEGSTSERAEQILDRARAFLRSRRYRVQRYDTDGALSVSAERGYARETGNLLFHIALLGVLIALGVGSAFTYTAQRVLVEGTSFVNQLSDYSSFNPGRFVTANSLQPFMLTLDNFDVSYVPAGTAGAGQAGDFLAHVQVRDAQGQSSSGKIRVNHPLEVDGTRVYLLGNGYAPTIVVRDPDGHVVYQDSVPFLSQDNNMTSLGVVKVPDGLSQQVGLVGFFYPTMQPLTTGAFTSVYPALIYPVLTLNVYVGDLGIDDGTPRSVYALDSSGMTQLTGGNTGVQSLELQPGQTTKLPNGLGTVTFVNAADPDASTMVSGPVSAQPTMGVDYADSVKRFVSLSIHHDAAGPWVFIFVVCALIGLLLALFIPRRRLWVKVIIEGEELHVQCAGLARGDDSALPAAVEQLRKSLDDAASTGDAPAD